MESLIIYDETGKVWLIAHGASYDPKELKSIRAEIPEEAQLTGMDLSDPENPTPVFYFAKRVADVDAVTNLVEQVKKRMEAGENLRKIISSLKLSDEEKWVLEKKVKEGK